MPNSQAPLTDLLISDRVGDVLYQQRLAALVRLLDVTRELAAEVDLNTILQTIAQAACQALVCERATLFQYDPARDELFTRVATELEVSEIRHSLDQGISGYVARHRALVNVRDPASDPRWSPEVDLKTGYRTRSILAAPLTSPRDGALLGVLQCLNNDGGPFDEFDEPLLEAFAQHAAVALDRARMVEQLRERQELDFALGLARDVQRRFMPERLPPIAGYDAATWWRPNQAVGGDYCDVMPLGDGRVGLVVADVSGHGLGVSLLMASVRAALRSLMLAHSGAGRLLEMLNHAMAADLAEGHFITMILAALDPRTHTLEFANAGHAPALHYSATTRQIAALESTGLPIGVTEDETYPLGTPISLAAGDWLLLSTDGIVEAARPDGEAFGYDRLHASIREFVSLPASEFVVRLGHRVEDFCGGQPPADDLTILAVRRTAS
ncbi:MAG TPA: GAF domain-containing SpoIIE family protein phosphatase [Pirellulales bacterium]